MALLFMDGRIGGGEYSHKARSAVDFQDRTPVVPENLIRADSRNEVESEHHST